MSAPVPSAAGSLRRLGRYTILESLAKGGMAQVYIAQKDNAPEICVLKQLLGELETHATAGKRFYREAHVASYLQHPRIARTIDAGFEDGAFCIAMEFIAGRDVESLMHLLMRQGRMLPYELSLSVALGVLEGLEYAHEARDPSGEPLDLVHRDLSPRNVMLSYDGEVKIIDFGLARGKVDDFKTAPGMILGTLRYVSPEQAVADPIDFRSDLYSIAVVLYEMLSGRPLVRDGTALEVLTDVVQRVPEAITARNPHLPKALDAVLARALAKAPEDRYPSARELRMALEDAAGTLARTPRSAIGEFVSSLFPQERDKALALLELGRRRHAELSSANRGAAQAGQRTLAGDIDPPDDLGSRTRTGFVDSAALGGGHTEDAYGSQTRTGWIAPVQMTPLDLGLSTRTVVEQTFLDPANARPGATTFDVPSPHGREPLPAPTGRMDRTTTMDLGSRTLVYPPSPATVPAPPRRDIRTPIAAYAMIGFVVISGAVVVGAMLSRAAEDVHVIPAGHPQAEGPVAAEAAPVGATPAAALASPVASAGPSPAAPSPMPETPAPRTASNGATARTSGNDAARRAGAPRAEATSSEGAAAPVETLAPRAPRATPKPAGKLDTLRRDIARFRQDWASLDASARATRFVRLGERLAAEAVDPTVSRTVERLVDPGQATNELEADLGRLESALRSLEGQKTP